MGKLARAWYGSKSFYYINGVKYEELKSARAHALDMSHGDKTVVIEDRDHQIIEKWKDGKQIAKVQ